MMSCPCSRSIDHLLSRHTQCTIIQTTAIQPNSSILRLHICVSWIGNFWRFRVQCTQTHCSKVKSGINAYGFIIFGEILDVWCVLMRFWILHSCCECYACDDILLTTFEIDTGYRHRCQTCREKCSNIGWIEVNSDSFLNFDRMLLHLHQITAKEYRKFSIERNPKWAFLKKECHVWGKHTR